MEMNNQTDNYHVGGENAYSTTLPYLALNRFSITDLTTEEFLGWKFFVSRIKKFKMS